MKRTLAAAAAITAALLIGACSNNDTPNTGTTEATNACLAQVDKLASAFVKFTIGTPTTEETSDGYRVSANVEGTTSDGTAVNREFSCIAFEGDNNIETRDVDWKSAGGATTTPPTTAPLTLREQYDARMTKGKIQNPAGSFEQDTKFCETLRTSDNRVQILAEAITRPEQLDTTTAHRISRIKEMIPILCPDQSSTVQQAGEEFNLYPGAQLVTPTTKPVIAPTTPPVVPKSKFGNGKFLVGDDIMPGTYAINRKVTDCYWERSDAQGNIIDNNFISIAPSITVTVGVNDAGFTSTGCGNWELVE